MWKNTCNVYMIHCRIVLKTYARSGLTPAGQIFRSDKDASIQTVDVTLLLTHNLSLLMAEGFIC